MIPVETAINTWVDRWRNLKAWRCSLDDIKVEVVPYKGTRNLGTCWPSQRRIRVRVQRSNPSSTMHTILHELAHAACPSREAHGIEWQTKFGNAVTEVTGVPVVMAGDNYEIVNDASRSAISHWWKASGEHRIWQMAVEGRVMNV